MWWLFATHSTVFERVSEQQSLWDVERWVRFSCRSVLTTHSFLLMRVLVIGMLLSPSPLPITSKRSKFEAARRWKQDLLDTAKLVDLM